MPGFCTGLESKARRRICSEVRKLQRALTSTVGFYWYVMLDESYKSLLAPSSARPGKHYVRGDKPNVYDSYKMQTLKQKMQVDYAS